MSDETTPSRDLRERIISDVENRCSHPGDGPLTPDGEHCASCWELAEDLWATVQPVLGQRDAELRRLRTLFDEAQVSLPIEQRRLLSISRMVFDRHAEGDTLSRDDAADLAQRIVDEIGHSVTEEPALGPSFRVEIAGLKAANDRVRALHTRTTSAVSLGPVCGSCIDAHSEQPAPWPCPTITALDQPQEGSHV